MAHASAGLFPVVGHMESSPHLSTTSNAGAGGLYLYSQLLLDPNARRGYQVVGWTNTDATTGLNTSETEITVFNLDSLGVVQRVQLDGIMPGLMAGDNNFAGSESFPAALKVAPSPRLFITAGQSTTRPGVARDDVVIVDLTSFAVTSVSVQPAPALCSQGGVVPSPCPVYGLSYDERSNVLWAYVAQSEANALGTVVTTFRFAAVAVDPAAQPPAVRATAQLPSVCNGPIFGQSGDDHEDQLPMWRSTDGSALWTICSEEQSGAAAYLVAPVSIPLQNGLPAASATPTVLDAVADISDAYADPGSDRLFLRQSASGDHTIIVFDGHHGKYVGSAGLEHERFSSNGAPISAPDTGNGVDPSSGRYYSFSDGGVFLVDGRRTDRQGFPQANVLPSDGPGRSGDRPVAVDPVTHHVFVLWYFSGPSVGSTAVLYDSQYTVYQDNVPLSSDVPLKNVDANTANVPLVPGSTVAIYAAHAQGFGSRSYTYNPAQVGTGTGSAQKNPAGGTSDVLEAGATTVAGQGSGADLTNNGAGAAGITADADNQTRQQFAKTNQPFPYTQLPCSDSSGTEVTAATSKDPGGSTQVDCNLAGGTATVTSTYRSSDTAGGKLVATSPAESDISIQVSYAVCPAAPVCNGIGSGPSTISTATATVHGIDLAAAVSVSYLQVTATAVAGGRGGTAVTKYATTIRGVHAGAFDCPTSCDPTTALQQINAALAQQLPGQVQVAFPAADPTAAAGTPKGYFAAVEKDSYALLNDTTVSGDSRPELCGMEEIRDNAILYNGSQAKQVTCYAGVEVESRFGITPLDLGFPIVGSGVITAGTSIPGTPGSAGQFVPGTQAGQGSANTGAPGGGRSGNGGPLAAIVNGLAFLLDWTQLPLMSLMWIVLLLPAYLATRRQRLEALAL